jgi:succinoglycan biosynthesis transport protein ExoP
MSRPIEFNMVATSNPVEETALDYGEMRPIQRVTVEPYDNAFKALIAVVRRHWLIWLAIIVVITGLAAAAATTIPPVYAAQAAILIDPGQHDVLDPTSAPTGAPPDEALVNTEISIIGSRDVANAVVDTLNLTSDPDFLTKSKANTAPPLPTVVRENVIDRLHKAVSVKRDGTSYLVQVQAQSRKPAKAALLANAVAEQYLVYNQNQKVAAALAEQTALSGNATDLQNKADAASEEVARYKAAVGLVDAAGPNGVNGTVTDQQASTLAAQLSLASSQAASDSAKAQAARNMVANGALDSIPEVMASPLINRLHEQRVDLAAQQVKIDAQYLPTHPEAVRVAQQIGQLDKQITSEAKNIVNALQSQAAASNQHAATIQSQLAGLTAKQTHEAQASVEAQSLERHAATLSQIADATSKVVERASQQAQVGRSQARIASVAYTPTQPISPNRSLIVMLGFILGFVLGAAVVTLIEILDSGLRTPYDVEGGLGLRYLASIPLAPAKYRKKRRAGSRNAVWDYGTDRPASSFAESLRSVRRSLRILGPSAKIVTITSALPNEGKTSTAVALARTMAMSGDRVLVIDCDLRRNALGQLFTSAPEVGLLELLASQVPVSQAVTRDVVAGVDVLPLTSTTFTADDIFGNGKMADLLERLSKDYDQIILDAPPVLAMTDARQLAVLSDVTILVARWGKTPKMAIRAAIDRLDSDRAIIAGLVMTMVNLKARGFLGEGDASYYHKSYQTYYLDS